MAGTRAADTTETGNYTFMGNTGMIARNAGWNYGLPSENDWYKEAYHRQRPTGLGVISRLIAKMHGASDTCPRGKLVDISEAAH